MPNLLPFKTYPAVTLRDTFVLWSDALTTIFPTKGCGIMPVVAILAPFATEPALFAAHWKLTQRMIDSGMLLERGGGNSYTGGQGYSFALNALDILERHHCIRWIKDCPTRICPALIEKAEPARQESIRYRDGLARLAESIIYDAARIADENRKERQHARN